MKKLALWLLFWGALLLFAGQTGRAVGELLLRADYFQNRPLILIDPGHGGEDGGATGASGESEKELNLSIALALAEELKDHGCQVLLTRDTDTALGDQNLSTVAQRKRSDLQERARVAEESGAQALVSIHQNFFEESQYSGAQMFYSPNHPDSQRLAECLRSQVVKSLRPENRRESKEAGEGIYLLEQCRIPGVLVECGFLSNPQEAGKLTDPQYQRSLAQALCRGIQEFLEGEAQG